ncbi:hypothetical protein [Bacteroides sp. MSB163]|uniref:hypothetical protein n=1 Tax=Bacteroides maternus TaxID=3117552 RepID=UPI002ED96730
METIVCKHEVHQVHQEADTLRYDLALSLVRSLMADVSEATTKVFQQTKPDMPEPDFFQGAGRLAAYAEISNTLRRLEIVLSQEAGIPLPSFEEEVAECC